MKLNKSFAMLSLLCIGKIATLQAANTAPVTFQWDASPPNENINQYNLYVGNAHNSYQSQFISPNNSYTATLIQGQQYFAVVAAQNNRGVESRYSQEISFTVPYSTTLVQGHVATCNSLGPAMGATVKISGSVNQTTITDSAGDFSFTVPTGASYFVTVQRASLIPGQGGSEINTVDAIAINQRYLDPNYQLKCEKAADTNKDGTISIFDVVAVNRFVLGRPNGIGFTGRYEFTALPPTLNFVQTLLGDCQ